MQLLLTGNCSSIDLRFSGDKGMYLELISGDSLILKAVTKILEVYGFTPI
jgi:hypothetical protein